LTTEIYGLEKLVPSLLEEAKWFFVFFLPSGLSFVDYSDLKQPQPDYLRITELKKVTVM